MKRWLLLTILVAALLWRGLETTSPRAVAEDPVSPPPVSERVLGVQRNFSLIQSLVQGGLRLAAEPEPQKRADQCLSVAGQLADEIRQAAEKRDFTRIMELGEHLHALLEQGVAANLRLARRRTPADSTAEKQLQEACDQATRLVRQLEEFLQSTLQTDGAAMEPMLRGLKGGLKAVDKAAREEAANQSVPVP
jgi:hypothetical protein